MVPRTSRQGRSFSGAWKYYAHDKRTAQQQAQGQEVRTRERVGFVHTSSPDDCPHRHGPPPFTCDREPDSPGDGSCRRFELRPAEATGMGA